MVRSHIWAEYYIVKQVNQTNKGTEGILTSCYGLPWDLAEMSGCRFTFLHRVKYRVQILLQLITNVSWYHVVPPRWLVNHASACTGAIGRSSANYGPESSTNYLLLENGREVCTLKHESKHCSSLIIWLGHKGSYPGYKLTQQFIWTEFEVNGSVREFLAVKARNEFQKSFWMGSCLLRNWFISSFWLAKLYSRSSNDVTFSDGLHVSAHKLNKLTSKYWVQFKQKT
jgi:hypothetical protein